MKIIDEWKAEAEEMIFSEPIVKNTRILALIELIERKDEALIGVAGGFKQFIYTEDEIKHCIIVTPETEKCRKALALTKELK